jgi:hypothetical protein
VVGKTAQKIAIKTPTVSIAIHFFVLCRFFIAKIIDNKIASVPATKEIISSSIKHPPIKSGFDIF